MREIDVNGRRYSKRSEQEEHDKRKPVQNEDSNIYKYQTDSRTNMKTYKSTRREVKGRRHSLPSRQQCIPHCTALREQRKDLPTRVFRVALLELHLVVEEKPGIAGSLGHEPRSGSGLVRQHGGTDSKKSLKGGSSEDTRCGL